MNLALHFAIKTFHGTSTLRGSHFVYLSRSSPQSPLLQIAHGHGYFSAASRWVFFAIGTKYEKNSLCTVLKFGNQRFRPITSSPPTSSAPPRPVRPHKYNKFALKSFNSFPSGFFILLFRRKHNIFRLTCKFLDATHMLDCACTQIRYKAKKWRDYKL